MHGKVERCASFVIHRQVGGSKFYCIPCLSILGIELIQVLSKRLPVLISCCWISRLKKGLGPMVYKCVWMMSRNYHTVSDCN